MNSEYPGEGMMVLLCLAMNLAGAVLFLESDYGLVEIAGIGLCCLGWYFLIRFMIYCDANQGKLRNERWAREASREARKLARSTKP